MQRDGMLIPVTLTAIACGPAVYLIITNYRGIMESAGFTATGTLKDLLGSGVFLLAGFCFDLAFIYITRLCLRWSLKASLFGILSTVFLNVVLAVILVGPLVLARGGLESSLLVYLSGSNIFDVLVSSVFLALAFGMLVHRIVWPLVDKPLYALQGLGIARRGKLLGVLGVVLLGYAGWGLPEGLKKSIQVILG
jgi:uncharacterized membrane protein